MQRIEERNKDELEEATTRVKVFESRNWIQFINKNVMSVIRFFSGPVKITLGWLDRIEGMIRHHKTNEGC